MNSTPIRREARERNYRASLEEDEEEELKGRRRAAATTFWLLDSGSWIPARLLPFLTRHLVTPRPPHTLNGSWQWSSPSIPIPP